MLEVFVFELGECCIIGKYFVLIGMRFSISYSFNRSFSSFSAWYGIISSFGRQNNEEGATSTSLTRMPES